MADIFLSSSLFASALERGSWGDQTSDILAALNVSLAVSGEADGDLSVVLDAQAQATDRNARAQLLQLAAGMLRDRGEKFSGTLRELHRRFMDESQVAQGGSSLEKEAGILLALKSDNRFSAGAVVYAGGENVRSAGDNGLRGNGIKAAGDAKSASAMTSDELVVGTLQVISLLREAGGEWAAVGERGFDLFTRAGVRAETFQRRVTDFLRSLYKILSDRDRGLTAQQVGELLDLYSKTLDANGSFEKGVGVRRSAMLEGLKAVRPAPAEPVEPLNGLAGLVQSAQLKLEGETIAADVATYNAILLELQKGDYKRLPELPAIVERLVDQCHSSGVAIQKSMVALGELAKVIHYGPAFLRIVAELVGAIQKRGGKRGMSTRMAIRSSQLRRSCPIMTRGLIITVKEIKAWIVLQRELSVLQELSPSQLHAVEKLKAVAAPYEAERIEEVGNEGHHQRYRRLDELDKDTGQW